MGRSDQRGDPDFAHKFHLHFLPLDSGGYDSGGAYWGIDLPLYWAHTTDGDEHVEMFVRARNMDAAKSVLFNDYPNATFEEVALHGVNVEEFVHGYIKAMLWSSNDESTPSGGEPLDSNYGVEDLSIEARETCETDCRAFLNRVGHLITDDNYRGTLREATLSEYAGHDFWLTRVGHGAGYWDGDWTKEAGDALTKAAKTFGEVNPYVQDDEKIGLA